MTSTYSLEEHLLRGQLSSGSSPFIKGLDLWMNICLLAWDENKRKYRHHSFRNYVVTIKRKDNLETERRSNTDGLPITRHFPYPQLLSLTTICETTFVDENNFLWHLPYWLGKCFTQDLRISQGCE